MVQIIDGITGLGGGGHIHIFDNMVIIQVSDYISTWNCNLVVIG